MEPEPGPHEAMSRMVGITFFGWDPGDRWSGRRLVAVIGLMLLMAVGILALAGSGTGGSTPTSTVPEMTFPTHRS